MAPPAGSANPSPSSAISLPKPTNVPVTTSSERQETPRTIPNKSSITGALPSPVSWQRWVVTRGGLHLPGNINYSGDSFDYFPNGVADLIGPDSIPTAGLVQIIACVGWIKCAFMRDVPGSGNEHVGDFRNGYIDFGWDYFDEETKLSKRAIKLNNGCAAMMGILGLMVHEEIVPLG